MSMNSSWASFGWQASDPTFASLASLNGGIRRAAYERTSWSQWQHLNPKQAWVLQGIASSDSSTLANVSESDFLSTINTLPDTPVFGGIKPAVTYLRTIVESENLRPGISNEGLTGDERLVINQFPFEWRGAYYVSGQFLVDADLVVEVDGSYVVRNYRFVPLRDGYTRARRFLDFWLYIPVSICAWMRTADTSSNTITASQDLLDISPHGWWICGYRNAGVSQTTYRKYALTDNVPMDTSAGTYAPTVRLYLDGRDFLKFQKDEED